MRYRATLAYVGTGFHGWQIQRNASRTVQAAVEDALARLEGAPVRAVAAGRTDAGVHAAGQVVHFDASPRDPRETRDRVNAELPNDVRFLAIAPAPPDFHARKDALWKEYVYRWDRAEVIPPREAPFFAPLSAAADPRRMAEAAAHLPGRRDFAVFGVRRSGEDDSVRSLHSVTVEECGSEIHAVFRGDGFLRGMVRTICGLLADIGRGRFPPDRMREILVTGDRTLLAQKAPAQGLTLVSVEYPRAKLSV